MEINNWEINNDGIIFKKTYGSGYRYEIPKDELLDLFESDASKPQYKWLIHMKGKINGFYTQKDINDLQVIFIIAVVHFGEFRNFNYVIYQNSI